jgi:outer membrane receptor protein involved in Fe transport
LSFSGDLKAAFSDNVTFGVSGSFNSYSTYIEQEAWNLPEVKLNGNIDFNITPKWFAGAAVFYVGERKDIQGNTDNVNVVAPSPITLDSYFDLNAHVGYKHNDRLTGFIRANNITNQAYERWLNYQVQGFQIVAGANYKFDF